MIASQNVSRRFSRWATAFLVVGFAAILCFPVPGRSHAAADDAKANFKVYRKAKANFKVYPLKKAKLEFDKARPEAANEALRTQTIIEKRANDELKKAKQELDKARTEIDKVGAFPWHFVDKARLEIDTVGAFPWHFIDKAKQEFDKARPNDKAKHGFYKAFPEAANEALRNGSQGPNDKAKQEFDKIKIEAGQEVQQGQILLQLSTIDEAGSAALFCLPVRGQSPKESAQQQAQATLDETRLLEQLQDARAKEQADLDVKQLKDELKQLKTVLTAKEQTDIDLKRANAELKQVENYRRAREQADLDVKTANDQLRQFKSARPKARP